MKAVSHSINYSKHSCPAVVVACMDFRISGNSIKELLVLAFEGEARVAPFDQIRIAGAAKAINDEMHRELILSNIKIAVLAHSASTVIVVNHHDCGAYGGVAKFAGDELAEGEFHAGELKKAGKIVADFLTSIGKSEVKVELAYLGATGLTPVVV